MARGGVEPPTFRFSVGRSYQLSYLAVACGTGVRTGEQNLTRAIRGPRKRCGTRVPYADPRFWPPSSSGPGPRPFTAVARVRIPLGVPRHFPVDLVVIANVIQDALAHDAPLAVFADTEEVRSRGAPGLGHGLVTNGDVVVGHDVPRITSRAPLTCTR